MSYEYTTSICNKIPLRLGVSAVEKISGHSEARYFSEADSELIRSVVIEPVR